VRRTTGGETAIMKEEAVGVSVDAAAPFERAA